MFDKFDDIIKRFVAVFLFPLINLLVIISIAYGVTKSGTSTISAAASGFFTSVLSTSTSFIQTNVTAIQSALHGYEGAVQTIGSAFAVTLFFTVFLSIYLIDRVVYYVGLFMPPNFQFDLASYEGTSNDARRSALSAIFEKDPCAIAKCYGAIRAYLGDKNADQYRLNQREKMVKGIETVKTVFAYTKAYLIYLLIVFASGAGISLWGAVVTLFLLLLVGAIAIGYLSFAYRTLVDYDLDSFIWERSYQATPKFDVSAISKLSDAGDRSSLLSEWLAKLFPAKFLRKRLHLKVVAFATEPS
jgi:hypothetical protein